MNSELNIPQSFKEYGIDEKEFNEQLEFMAENAVKDACTGANPRKVDKEMMAKIYKCSYNGEKVDF